MLQFLFISALLFGAASMVLACLSFLAFDRLLRQIKHDSEAAWIALGHPIGFFWVPPGVPSVTRSSFVRTTLYTQWCSRSAPPPPAGDPALIARLRTLTHRATILYTAGVSLFLLSLVILWL